jgi:hypothetical protein
MTIAMIRRCITHGHCVIRGDTGVIVTTTRMSTVIATTVSSFIVVVVVEEWKLVS